MSNELPDGCFPIIGREHLASLFIHLPVMGRHERACAVASIIAHIGLQAQCLTAQAERIAQLDADLEDIRHSEAMVRKESSDRAERIAELEELNSHLRMAVADRAAVIKLMRDRAEAAEAEVRELEELAAWAVEVADLWNCFNDDCMNPIINPAMRYSLDRDAECAAVELRAALAGRKDG